jgi:hypothetical protein
MLLDRNAILTADDLKTTDVEVPEWGGTVRVTSLTGTQRDAYGRSMIDKDGKPSSDGFAHKLLALAVVGEDGKPLFTLDDVEALGGRNAAALQRVYDAAAKLNGLAPDAVETAAKN